MTAMTAIEIRATREAPQADAERASLTEDRELNDPSASARPPLWILPGGCRRGAGLVAATAGVTSAQSLSAVPGTVLRSLPSPPSIGGFVIGSPQVHAASPSIAVLPGGESGASISGTTRVFRSTDKGATWTVTGTLSGMKRGSLFVSGSSLQLMGYLTDNGNSSYPADAVIRRSTDGGRTWTSATSASTGLLGTGGGGTPHAPVEYGGRLWVAQGGKRGRSIAVGADPLVRIGKPRARRRCGLDAGGAGLPTMIVPEPTGWMSIVSDVAGAGLLARRRR